MKTNPADGKKRTIPWIYSALPASVATGPLGTLIQLHLYNINGPSLGVIYASLAVSAFNGVSIPAAMFWGFATDRIHSRKKMLASAYGLMAVVLVSFAFVSSTAGTILAYSIFSFISASTATPLNLLIMETEPKGTWAGAFARLSMMSSVGFVGGLILSSVWAAELPIVLLSIPLGLSSLVSCALAYATIQEPRLVLERKTMTMRQPSFFSRLLSLPLVFLSLPRPSDFRRVFRGLRYELTSYVPLFYISLILFYLSSGIFNTSFVPALSTFSLSSSEAFAVILAGMLVQTLAFRYAGKYLERRSLEFTSIQGLLLRGVCYALIGAFALVLGGPAFIAPALVLYPVAAGIAFVAYYTSSNTLMFNLVQGRSPGSVLGVYSAVVGIATLVGSLVSGFISVLFGFDVTFTAAAVLLFVAAAVMARLPSRDEHPR